MFVGLSIFLCRFLSQANSAIRIGIVTKIVIDSDATVACLDQAVAACSSHPDFIRYL